VRTTRIDRTHHRGSTVILPDYPDALAEVHTSCPCCSWPIESGEIVYLVNGTWCCDDCATE
jgi:hypothetical protein